MKSVDTSILCLSSLLLLSLVVSVWSNRINDDIAESQCNRKAVVFNFGDSNSDTGGFCYSHGVTFGPPTGRVFLHNPSRRLCDGRLMIDFFCESLNISYLTAYMQSEDPNFTNGANFAVSGSATLPQQKGYNLDVQIDQFLQFRAHSLDINSINGSRDLVSEEDFSNALYTIDIGQNDLYISLSHHPYSRVIEIIPSFISQIQSSIQTLYQSGGKNFWIHNTGPLGCLPRVLAVTDHSESDLDDHGCLESRNDAAKEFNRQLNVVCEKLRSELKDSTIVYIDIYSIKYNVIANPSLYGFENPLMACCGFGGPPYNVNVNHSCGGSSFDVCEVGSKFISWDGIHYSQEANAVFAAQVLSANYSVPPIKLQYFCNA